ncbi:pimeloyl-ACP methyl ester carboxylesterase [Haloactinospora alba]|uniref:Pimeloyl-ACP methyl ester carboxylesterase n=1 Tax=Haloactinospora alba TaxID=405555 RepID=A0A543NIP1_9ACTN|nr:alpha/beta hydrolase [Haloactinospora alba]TQN31620.1 pimeloyl-ACP methyl ester carboxylesterase [Haloactinospora alba]
MPTTNHHETSVTSADGTRLHVEVHGPDNAPTLVLSHGWTCAVPFWAPVTQALSSHLRVVLYDQRGHGRSDLPPRSGYSTTALADDLCAVLQATVPSGTKAVIGGHSMGGMTIMAAAQRTQLRERAAAVLLASTGSADLTERARVLPGSHRWPKIGGLGHRLVLGAPLPLGPVTPLSRAALRYMTMTPEASPTAVDVCARLVHSCPTTSRAAWGGVMSELNLDTGVQALDMPTIVLTGTADKLTPLPHAHRMAGMLPDCREVVEIPNVGHMTPMEVPNRVSSVLSELAATHLDATPPATDGKQKA